MPTISDEEYAQFLALKSGQPPAVGQQPRRFDAAAQLQQQQAAGRPLSMQEAYAKQQADLQGPAAPGIMDQNAQMQALAKERGLGMTFTPTPGAGGGYWRSSVVGEAESPEWQRVQADVDQGVRAQQQAAPQSGAQSQFGGPPAERFDLTRAQPGAARAAAAQAAPQLSAQQQTPAGYAPPAGGDTVEARQAYYDRVVAPQYQQQQAQQQQAAPQQLAPSQSSYFPAPSAGAAPVTYNSQSAADVAGRVTAHAPRGQEMDRSAQSQQLSQPRQAAMQTATQGAFSAPARAPSAAAPQTTTGGRAASEMDTSRTDDSRRKAMQTATGTFGY